MLLQHDAITHTSLFNVMSQDEEEGVDTGDVLDEWSHGKSLNKPADQLELTDAVRDAQGSSFFNTDILAL